MTYTYNLDEFSRGIGNLMKGKGMSGLGKVADPKKLEKLKKEIEQMKARLKKEDKGINIAKKMMHFPDMRHMVEKVSELETITPEELVSMLSSDNEYDILSLFIDEASEEGKVRIIKTKDNKFQVQRMTKGNFVDQGKPYKSLKQAEKERSTGQSSMQFESEISWDFDGVMVRITQSDFDKLPEDLKDDTDRMVIEGNSVPVLFIAEVRQMKDNKKESMVQKNGKVKVIDKKDEKKYLDMGYSLAEAMKLTSEEATPEKIMKDIAALEKMLTKFGGNSSSVKMKKVAIERKIAKLEKDLENMDEGANVSEFLEILKEYGYGKKVKKEELTAGQKKLPPKLQAAIAKKSGSSVKEGADDYEDHMMYDPKTGKGRMTTSYEDHLALKDNGWGHEKPTKESVNPYESLYGKPVDEAVRGNSGPVTVNKKKYSWGNMITVNHGNSVSYPLHPKQQLKIKNLKDGESTNFEDETGEKVAAKRVGDKVHLRQSGVNAKTTVDYKHFNESYGKPLDERKLTWKDWERQGNDAWMSREKRKDNPYKKKGQARTSWFDGWDNMQMDSDNGDFDESYDKMNASKMSSKEKAKARALAKADKDAQPKDKVSLKKAPWEKKDESVELEEKSLKSRAKSVARGMGVDVDNVIRGMDFKESKFENILDEAKSDYTIMHKSYSDAMQHSYEVAKSRGYEVDMDDVDAKVASGPRKPSDGKTNSHNLTITKGGKSVKKRLNVQVYNKGGSMPYELNMYIESLEESLSPTQIEKLKGGYEQFRDKKISASSGMKISKSLAKLDKESLAALINADIPFVSTLAYNKLMMVHGMDYPEIEKLLGR